MIKSKRGAENNPWAAPRTAGSNGSSSQSPFAWLVSKIIRIGSIVFILGILILAGIVGYNQYVSGRGATAVLHGEVAAENVAFPVLFNILGAETYNALFRPQIAYGFESDIDQTQQQDVGIKGINLQQLGRPGYGEPIEVLGRFTAASPLQDLEIIVECQLGEGQIVPATVSSSSARGNSAYLFRGDKETITATCLFAEGLNPNNVDFATGVKKPTFDSASPIETTEDLPLEVPGKVTMFIRYNFYSKASHRTYLLSKEVVSGLLRRDPPVDIFEYYGVVDPQLKSDRTVTSQATPGPLNLGIGTYSSQPFVEGTPYSFAVTLTNNFGEWKGNLKKLDSLEVMIPPYIRLETDQDFGNVGQVTTCPFIYDHDGENGFRVYKLKDEELEKVNKECTKEVLQSSSLTLKGCINIFDTAQVPPFICKFKNPDTVYERIAYDFMRSEAHYIYQTQQAAVVKAYRTV